MCPQCGREWARARYIIDPAALPRVCLIHRFMETYCHECGGGILLGTYLLSRIPLQHIPREVLTQEIENATDQLGTPRPECNDDGRVGYRQNIFAANPT